MSDMREKRLGHSSKLSCLINDISTQRQTERIIVFSSWTRTLHIVACLLESRGIPVLQINGSVLSRQRDKIIASFEKAQNNVLLMTLGTGAVGLNLTIADRVHIIEPQWNLSIEEQAIGCVLRLRQRKTVYVTRYIVKDSIEYVRDKQLRKLKLAEVGWSGQSKEMQKTLDLLSTVGQQ
ncbi:P-loop containing nucleoside triphosphate hydrolase protein [Aspergillus multicolor]|uniref:C-terminal helicase domain-containing protein n=1 Tax=Aspergillus multicolor TaxID=41759 RepID=UPI003CCE35E2